MKTEILRLQNISKKIGNVTFLDNINQHIFKGEIMGLLTLNTVGKEELLNILLNKDAPDRGEIYFDEELVRYNLPSPNIQNKVYMIEKTSKLFSNLTVADNIFVMRPGFKKYIINSSILNSQAQLFLKELHTDILAYTWAEDLSAFERCIVELIKASAMGAKLIILNDMSSFLSSSEWNSFFEAVNIFRNKGFSFLCVDSSHDGLLRISSRLSLMRNGSIIKMLAVDSDTREKILPFIIEPPQVLLSGSSPIPKTTVLDMIQVSTEHLHEFSLQISKGECVVITDLNNTIILDFIGIFSGRLPINGGIIDLCGHIYTRKIPSSSVVLRRVSVLNEHPMQSMLFRDLSYVENLCFVSGGKIRNLWRKYSLQQSVINEYLKFVGDNIYLMNIDELDDLGRYDLVYYRIHLLNPRLLICIQPFSGADMYLRSHIAGLLNFLRQRGITLLLLTVNPTDTLSLADRLILVRNGKQIKEYGRTEFSHIDPDELFFGDVVQKSD